MPFDFKAWLQEMTFKGDEITENTDKISEKKENLTDIETELNLLNVDGEVFSEAVATTNKYLKQEMDSISENKKEVIQEAKNKFLDIEMQEAKIQALDAQMKSLGIEIASNDVYKEFDKEKSEIKELLNSLDDDVSFNSEFGNNIKEITSDDTFLLEEKVSNIKNNKLKSQIVFDKLKVEYFDDLKKYSEYPETIDESLISDEWNEISTEVNSKMRDEFCSQKNALISDWESKNGYAWPTYKKNVYSPTGKLIRQAGDKYDAHHIKPLTFGGKNTSANITPLHALVHFDKQGIHAPDSAFGKMKG